MSPENLGSPAVDAVSIKLPPFWSHSAKLWFAQAEAQFILRQVTSSLTKYYYVIATLPDHVAADVDDLLEPEPSNPYEHLKAKLLQRFGESHEERLHKLIHAELRADQKPSQLLREMRRLAEDKAECDSSLFRRLFLDRLPTNIQLLLKASPTTDLDELARKADELASLAEHSTVAEVTLRSDEGSDLQALREQMARLEAKVNTVVAAVPTGVRFFRSRSTSPRPARRNVKLQERHNLCYYHRKFGAAARQCRPPCSFQGNVDAGI